MNSFEHYSNLLSPSYEIASFDFEAFISGHESVEVHLTLIILIGGSAHLNEVQLRIVVCRLQNHTKPVRIRVKSQRSRFSPCRILEIVLFFF